MSVSHLPMLPSIETLLTRFVKLSIELRTESIVLDDERCGDLESERLIARLAIVELRGFLAEFAFRTLPWYF